MAEEIARTTSAAAPRVYGRVDRRYLITGGQVCAKPAARTQVS